MLVVDLKNVWKLRIEIKKSLDNSFKKHGYETARKKWMVLEEEPEVETGV